MTVITYRNGVMAGDSCWSDDGFVVNIQNKILRLPSGALYGGAGAPDDRAFVKLLSGVEYPEELPEWGQLQRSEFTDLECLLVLPDQSVWTIEGGEKGYGVSPVQTPFTAIGAGREVAIGALASGASAQKAVKVACQWHRTCCEPVYTLKLWKYE